MDLEAKCQCVFMSSGLKNYILVFRVHLVPVLPSDVARMNEFCFTLTCTCMCVAHYAYLLFPVMVNKRPGQLRELHEVLLLEEVLSHSQHQAHVHLRVSALREMSAQNQHFVLCEPAVKAHQQAPVTHVWSLWNTNSTITLRKKEKNISSKPRRENWWEVVITNSYTDTKNLSVLLFLFNIHVFHKLQNLLIIIVSRKVHYYLMFLQPV